MGASCIPDDSLPLQGHQLESLMFLPVYVRLPSQKACGHVLRHSLGRGAERCTVDGGRHCTRLWWLSFRETVDRQRLRPQGHHRLARLKLFHCIWVSSVMLRRTWSENPNVISYPT